MLASHPQSPQSNLGDSVDYDEALYRMMDDPDRIMWEVEDMEWTSVL